MQRSRPSTPSAETNLAGAADRCGAILSSLETETRMLTGCPNCGTIYETTTENAYEPSWSNPKARWCRKCLGLPERSAERLSEHERQLREHYDNPAWESGWL